MRGGRPRGTDPTKRNILIASLAYICRKDTLFFPYLLTFPRELNMMYDYLDRVKDEREKLVRGVDPSTVPRKMLEKFVYIFFGMNRITFIRHMKKVIAEGIVEEVRLRKKGKLYGYVLKVEKPRDYLIISGAMKKHLDHLRKNQEAIDRVDPDRKAVDRIQGEIINELGLEPPDKTAHRGKGETIWEKYPSLSKAYDYYFSSHLKSSKKYDSPQERGAVEALSDRMARRVVLHQQSTRRYVETPLAAQERLKRDIVENRICRNCLLRDGTVSYLQKPEPFSRLASCVHCGRTLEVDWTEAAIFEKTSEDERQRVRKKQIMKEKGRKKEPTGIEEKLGTREHEKMESRIMDMKKQIELEEEILECLREKSPLTAEQIYEEIRGKKAHIPKIFREMLRSLVRRQAVEIQDGYYLPSANKKFPKSL